MSKASKNIPRFEQPRRPPGRKPWSSHVRILAVAHVPWNVECGDPTPLPYIRLKGRWLAKAGFAAASRIAVTVQKGRLTIRPFEEKKTHASDGR
jgi:hypothetical protein